MMTSFPINLKILPFVIYLSSKSILDKKLYKSLLLDDEELENLIFLEQRKQNCSLPNYIHKSYHQYISQENKKITFLNSLEEISSYYLIDQKDQVYIKDNLLEEWQVLLTHLNSIHIVSYLYHYKKMKNKKLFASTSILNTKPSDLIDKFFKRNKFIDTHIHLNGTSEVIFSWQYFLNNPKTIYKKLKSSLHFEQLGFKNSSEIFLLIEKAKYIQENLIYIIDNKHNEDLILKFEVVEFMKKQNFIEKEKEIIHPIQNLIKDTKHNIPTYELLFFEYIYILLDDEKVSLKLKIYVKKLLHIYLLIYSQFNKILVQQYEQYGFDQFQMITDNGVRDFYEDLGYRERFLQLKGNNNINFELLEGRFAPKKDIYKTYKLLNKMIFDYMETKKSLLEKGKENKYVYLDYVPPAFSNQFSNKNRIKNLSLTAHFIKDKNTNCVTSSNEFNSLTECPRHANLRKKLYKQASILINFIKVHKGHYLDLKSIVPHSYFNFINGIDAAGNELNARPEVFAPTFNFVRKELNDIEKNIGFTFHAGEDFIHIISGIRYIYEAVVFLDMVKKDRIGHGTALGIDPYMWKNKLNNKLLIKKGEWLDNLIFLCKTLNLSENMFPEIKTLWKEIYKTDFPSLDDTFKAYELRKYDPDKLILKKESYLNDLVISEDSNIKNIYSEYHYNNNLKKEYNELIPLTITDYIDFIEPLQKSILKLLKYKEIAIEVMPTSNTRISFYDKYEEHHIFKWLDKKDIPDLIIATDDPGIFNTNLQNEYLHLYNVLSLKYEKTDEYIVKVLKTLSNNSKKYAFR